MEQQDAAVALFRRLMQEYYPNSTDHDITHYQSSRCSFEQMSQYFDANTIDQTDPIDTRIQSEILEALPKVTQGNEREAFEKLENVIKKLGEKGDPEQDIPGLVKQFNSSSKTFVKRFPELASLILEYKTARAVYDTVLNQWATHYVQSLNPSNRAQPLSGRATFVLPNAKLGVFDRLLHFFLGCKTAAFRMYESRNQYFLNDDHRDFRSFLDRYAHLENPLLSAINSAAQKFHTDLQFTNLSEVKEWLQNPTDPRVSLPEKRETFVTAMIKAVEKEVNAICYPRQLYNMVNPQKLFKGDQPSQSQPLRPLFIDAFEQLGAKYKIPEEIIKEGINNWLTQPPTNISLETYQQLTAELRDEILRIVQLSDRTIPIKIPSGNESHIVKKFQNLAQEYPQAFKRKNETTTIEIQTIEDVKNWLRSPINSNQLEQAKVLLEFTDWIDDKRDLDLEDEEQIPSFTRKPNTKQTKVNFPEGPIGYTYQIPSFTTEERLLRAAPEYEKGAKGEMQSNPTLNLDEDRIWEKSTRDTLLQIRSSIEQLDQESQKRAIYEFGICAKKHFGKDFNAPSQISEIQTFLSSQRDNQMDQKYKEFAEELTLSLSNLAVEQEKRIQRESYAELLLR